mgnify:CR=1 FL=1
MTTRWGEFQGRIEDDRLITGRGQYISDIALDGMAFGVVVRAQVPSARIRSIDTAAALAHPGVLAIYTAADLEADGIEDFPCSVALPRTGRAKVFPARRPILARDRIRIVGEGVAFVVAETQAQAETAAELVVVEIEDLPVLVDHRAARERSAPRVWRSGARFPPPRRSRSLVRATGNCSTATCR